MNKFLEMKKVIVSIIVGGGILLVSSTSALALTLNIDSSGYLAGASEIAVGGSLYDVAFMDGAGSVLYNGGDDVTDFFFQDIASATAAAQALLAQVFTGFWDTNPGMVVGTIGAPARGQYYTAYQPFANSDPFNAVYTINDVLEVSDQVRDIATSATSLSFDIFGINNGTTWAIWSESAAAPIPEPATMLLLGIGLIGLAGFGRKKFFKK